MKKKVISIILSITIIIGGQPVFGAFDIKDSGFSALFDQFFILNNTASDISLMTDEGEETPVQSEEPEETPAQSEEPEEPEETPAQSEEPEEPEETPVQSEEPEETPTPLPDLTASLQSGSVTVSEDGIYQISGKGLTLTNGLTIEDGADVTIVLSDTTLTTATTSAITVQPGAKLKLVLEGTNVMSASAANCAVIAVTVDSSDTSKYGSLTIEGDGSLEVTGESAYSVAIGANRGTQNGEIIIVSGNITVTGGTAAAAIGNSYGNQKLGKDITIRGGIINATGGAQAAAIGGGGGNSGASSNIIIEGGLINATGGLKSTGTGTVAAIGHGPNIKSDITTTGTLTINGGSVKGTIAEFSAPKDSLGNNLRQIILEMPDSATMANVEVSADDWTTYTDEDAKLYIYVSESVTSYSVHYNDKEYYTNDITTEENTYTLTEYSGDPCSCNENNASINLDAVNDVIVVNKIENENRVKLVTNFVPYDGCTFPGHLVSTVYTLTIDGQPVDEDIAKQDGNYLVVYYAAVGKTINLKADATMNGYHFSASKDITINGDDVAKFNLTQGSITVEVDTSDLSVNVITQGSSTYSLPNTTRIYIEQGIEASISNTITVSSPTARIALNNINIKTTLSNAITLREGTNLDLELIGNNVIYSTNTNAIQGSNLSSTLTINGEGTLDIRSGDGAGIGKLKTLTINSGTVIATGGNGGAGIGGGQNSTAGIEVIVNGGKVYAYGEGNGAGIGGGSASTEGAGGSFTINGGKVVAKSGGDGYDIGAAAQQTSQGTITYNGGNLIGNLGTDVYNSAGTQYFTEVSIEGITDETDVTYSIGDDNSNPISTFTDENGKIYMYLNLGQQWIRVYKDGKTYYRYATIYAEDNELECVENPVANLISFNIAGQIDDTVIDQDNLTVNITVPYNIKLTNINPQVEFYGSYAQPSGTLNFDNSDNSAVFSVVGDNKISKDYTVKLTLSGQPLEPAPDVYDISKGSIIITGTYVRYGGTDYNVNPLGYIIQGTTMENILRFDYTTDPLPPITLDNVNIKSVTQTTPVSAYVGADITVVGDCRITAMSTTALEVKNAYSSIYPDGIDLNFTGDGKLTIESTALASAVKLNTGTSMSVIGTTTEILTGQGSDAIKGTGTFYTDSETYMHIISSSNPEVIPLDADGNQLYQVTAFINADDKSNTKCVYNDKEYYVGENATLYLMMPNGEHNLLVTYDGKDYRGTAIINNASYAVTLFTTKVSSVKYSQTQFPYTGGTLNITFTGTLIAGYVKVKLVPDDESYETLEVMAEEINGSDVAVFELPKNGNYEAPVVYSVSYFIAGEEISETTKIIVAINNTQACITSFKIPGQVGETEIFESEEYNAVNIYMPYDHVMEESQYYTPSELTFKGGSISPNQKASVLFTLDQQGFMRATYTVTAADNFTTKSYLVKLTNETTPKIRTLAFTNPTSSDGGEVTVTAGGVAMENIQNAEFSENREVYIYSEDDSIQPVKAERIEENGVITYVATITVPSNSSYTESAKFPLLARIGSVLQTEYNIDIATVTVPRRERAITDIRSFNVENQVGSTEIKTDSISLTMPYDADLTKITPDVILDDAYALYTPLGECDFTSDVEYTVTAEDGTTKVYTVHIDKQETPYISDIEFSNPQYSGAGRIMVKLNGEYLDNAQYAMNHSKYITVTGTLISGDSENSTIVPAYASKDDNGDYIAVIVVPQNNTNAPKEYELSAFIGDVEQVLTGNTVLTVPAKELTSKELTDIILTEDQSALTFSGSDVYFYVPYNTDLRNITPEVYISGVSYTPHGSQNFNNAVEYTVTAQDGSTNTYSINALRRGSPSIESLTVRKPENFKDGNLTIDLEGQFVPYLTDGIKMDVIEISAVPRDGGDAVNGTVEYDSAVYGGHAVATLKLPDNMTDIDKIYDITLTINGVQQWLGSLGVITMPRRTQRSITSFLINGQVGSTQIDNDKKTIFFSMPYNMDLTALKPIITIDGDNVTVGGVTTEANDSGVVDAPAQDFDSKTVQYTVSAAEDDDVVYNATAERYGTPTISSVTLLNTPKTFKDTTVELNLEGVFFYDVKIKALCDDGTEVSEENIDITMNEWHNATAKITIPENLDTVHDKIYTLEFYLDGFEEPIISSSPVKITVPRRKTRAITNFIVNNQIGSADIQESDIYIKVEYNTDLRNITPLSVTIDGDSYSPTDTQNFYNDTLSLVYTVYADDDEDREYTVHIARDGKPSISKLSFASPMNFKGGSVTANIEGVFFETAQVYLVPDDGGAEIPATITSFAEGKATAVANIPINYDTEEDKVYKFKFIMDGFVITYAGGIEVTVPRRTTREITEFTLPDIQEGETKIEGTSIYINVPYYLDITSVTPEITYDADKITSEGAQDFSDTANPVKYTLSSSGDEDVTYTVYITRVGQDPYLKSLTVENQASETVYDGDNVSLTLKSNAKLNSVEPVLEYEGTDYSPKGPQDFSNSTKEPLVYTVVNEYGIEHKYYVTIDKKKSSGGGSSSEPASTPTPTPEPTQTSEPIQTMEPEQTEKPTPTPEPIDEITTKPYISGYDEDGVLLFKPDNAITRAEVTTILSVLDGEFEADSEYENVFSDIGENTWYRNYINFAAAKGYISGYDDGLSRPDNMITRAEFASMIARYIDILPVEGEDRFSDIERFEWCRQEINALADSGIVSGYEGGVFLPDNFITRAETVSIINRILGREMTEEILARITCPFEDITSQHWAYNDVLLASCEY